MFLFWFCLVFPHGSLKVIILAGTSQQAVCSRCQLWAGSGKEVSAWFLHWNILSPCCHYFRREFTHKPGYSLLSVSLSVSLCISELPPNSREFLPAISSPSSGYCSLRMWLPLFQHNVYFCLSPLLFGKLCELLSSWVDGSRKSFIIAIALNLNSTWAKMPKRMAIPVIKIVFNDLSAENLFRSTFKYLMKALETTFRCY